MPENRQPKKADRVSAASMSPLAPGFHGQDDSESIPSTQNDVPSISERSVADASSVSRPSKALIVERARSSSSAVSIASRSSIAATAAESINPSMNSIVIKSKNLPFYKGGVRPQHVKIVRFIGRSGFIAKGVVYGIIGVLIMTNVAGAYTPNGSQGNESPQGAFLLLGGIPAIGRPILVVMAIGLITYLVWRFWEAITGQGYDATRTARSNFFKYRLSPIVSGGVYCGYLYYLIQMIYQTSEEQQNTASSKEFPATWTDSVAGSAFVGIFGVAFLIALVTQLINAVTANFIPDLKTSAPDARKWEARIVNIAGRIGFGARGAMFGTLSGFFWDSLAKRNESGNVNMIAAAIAKLSNHTGGKFFMVFLGLGLIIYGLFAISNAHYKYFPTPPPSRIPTYIFEIDQNDEVAVQYRHDGLPPLGPKDNNRFRNRVARLIRRAQRTLHPVDDVEKALPVLPETVHEPEKAQMHTPHVAE